MRGLKSLDDQIQAEQEADELDHWKAPVSRDFTVQQRTRGRKWQRIRWQVLSDNPLCVECEKAGKVKLAAEVDHVTPIHKGGTDDASNLQGLCHEHHAEKSAREQGKAWRPTIGVDGSPVGGW